MKKTISLLLIICIMMAFLGYGSSSSYNTVINAQAVSDQSVNTKSSNTEMYDPTAGIDYSSEKKYIIQNGDALYQVVIPVTSTEAEVHAAEELVKYVQKSTGVSMSIITDDKAVLKDSSKYISIGATSVLDYCNFGVDYNTLNVEGFFIKTKGNLIVLDGANERATIYAVYDFLEKFVGVRFLTQDVEHIPAMDELYIYSLDITEVPYFSNRDIFASIGDIDTFTKMRVSSGLFGLRGDAYGGSYNESYFMHNNGHSFHTILPPATYKAEHPEWYAGVDGKQICLTNDEVLEEMYKVITEGPDGLLNNPKIEYIMVAQEDSSALCDCETCTASHELNGGESGTLVIFLNKLNRKIQEWIDENQPDRVVRLETFAYETTMKPPTKTVDGEVVAYNDDVIVDDDITIKIAHVETNYFRPLNDENDTRNAKYLAQMQGWAAVANSLFIYDYTCDFSAYMYYYASIGSLAENYRTYKELGATKVLTQHNGTGENTLFQEHLKTYLISKLMWNPNRQVSDLINEFCTLYFGKDVAGYVVETMTLFESYYASKNFYGKINHLSDPDYSLPANISPVMLREAIALLDKAEVVVRTSNRSEEEKEEILTRIASFKVTPQYMLLNGYDTYYLDDEEGRLTLAQEFFDNCERINITYYREDRSETIYSLKAEWLN